MIMLREIHIRGSIMVCDHSDEDISVTLGHSIFSGNIYRFETWYCKD